MKVKKQLKINKPLLTPKEKALALLSLKINKNKWEDMVIVINSSLESDTNKSSSEYSNNKPATQKTTSNLKRKK